jgi:hypothetical protein
MAKVPRNTGGKNGTDGGNGGYGKRKPIDMGVNTGFKMQKTGEFAATGKTNKTKKK